MLGIVGATRALMDVSILHSVGLNITCSVSFLDISEKEEKNACSRAKVQEPKGSAVTAQLHLDTMPRSCRLSVCQEASLLRQNPPLTSTRVPGFGRQQARRKETECRHVKTSRRC